MISSSQKIFFDQDLILQKFKIAINPSNHKRVQMLEWLFGKKKQEEPQKKPKKNQKQQQDEDKWMYDFMIQFLMSPLWQITILDFVDSKCVVFDNEEENKFEYTIIHNEFKEIVGNLVDGMMEEIGMGQDKLAELIEKGLESKQKKIFNQLLLADDFLRFKDLMLKRNKILEEQAIKALKQSNTKESVVQNKPYNKKNDYQAQLLRQSKRMEEERQKKLEEEEAEMLRKAIQLSKIESKEQEAIKALEEKAVDKEEEKVVENKEQKQQASKAKQPSKLQPLVGTTSTNKTFQIGDLPPLKGSLHRPSPKGQQEFNHQTKHQKVEQLKPQLNKQSVVEQSKPQQHQQEHSQPKQPTQSLQDRKQRLMAQREKIRKQKEEQRRKQLEQELHQSKEKESQPVVQTIVLQEEGFFDETSNKKEPVKAQQGGVSEDELKKRKQLMNKIKNRIIDDF